MSASAGQVHVSVHSAAMLVSVRALTHVDWKIVDAETVELHLFDLDCYSALSNNDAAAIARLFPQLATRKRDAFAAMFAPESKLSIPGIVQPCSPGEFFVRVVGQELAVGGLSAHVELAPDAPHRGVVSGIVLDNPQIQLHEQPKKRQRRGKGNDEKPLEHQVLLPRARCPTRAARKMYKSSPVNKHAMQSEYGWDTMITMSGFTTTATSQQLAAALPFRVWSKESSTHPGASSAPRQLKKIFQTPAYDQVGVLLIASQSYFPRRLFLDSGSSTEHHQPLSNALTEQHTIQDSCNSPAFSIDNLIQLPGLHAVIQGTCF